jgi:magnesium chelatase family protein
VLACVHTYTLHGIEAIPVRVEVYVAASSFPRLVLVGLPDPALRESRERIIVALRNQGLRFPDRKITVSLAPAGLPKAGAAFDLPIAIGLLVASGQAPASHLGSLAWAGELSLEGRVRPVRGCLSMALAESARAGRARTLVLPAGNGVEAAAGGIPVGEVATLADATRVLFEGPGRLGAVTRADGDGPGPRAGQPDMADVRGQRLARRAMEVAAAGGHNVLLIGPPGTGKSMLAERLPGILPPLTHPERLEVTRVHSAAGLIPSGQGLVAARPFRAPHHTISQPGLIGGGRPPRPGEISLAHRGVLFLDELPEFPRSVLESLRQPLESGEVVIARSGWTVRLPSAFQFVAAMNPCPCGRWDDPRGGCRCTPTTMARYRARVSGPLLDRIDIHQRMASVTYLELSLLEEAEDSAAMLSRVMVAWERQKARYDGEERIYRNAQMRLQQIRQHCRLDDRSQGLLRMGLASLGLSPRAYHRVLRLARTLADLDDRPGIAERHVIEALSYRDLDRGNTGGAESSGPRA